VKELDRNIHVLHALMKPGERLSCRRIADACGGSWQRIWQVEQRALHKLKKQLFLRNNPDLKELVESVFRQ
jgi:DNA-directed RNA polymerase sigma subunit (sigma70/sigma32)